jgi:hypothetical protein
LDVFRTRLVHPACGFIRADDEDGPLLLLWFAAFESMRESSGFHFDALRLGWQGVIDAAAGWFVPPVYYLDSCCGWFVAA